MKRKKLKLVQAVFLFVCLLFVLVFPLGMLAFGPSPALANERQSAKPQLVSGGRFNADVFSETADYISDHFYLRRELITARSRLIALLGSSAVEDVTLGKSGWLYYTPTLDDYTGSDPMSDAEIFSAARNLYLMQEYCESRGARFLFAVAPNKNSLYGENMPGRGGRAAPAEHNAMRLHVRLDEFGVRYADLFAAIAARPETLYFAHDSHWTSKGAALGADEINRGLGRASNYYGASFSEGTAHTGDLWEMLYPAAADTETDPSYGGALDYARDNGTRPDAITINTISGAGEGSLLAFRDSFGNLLYPYLADSFRTARFSRAAEYDLTQIGALGVDCVLIELVERNLRYLLENVPTMPAPARTVSATVRAAEAEAVVLETDTGAAAGHTLVRGTLPGGSDALSPVYVVCGGTAYEAFTLKAGGFAAWIPDTGAAPEKVLFSVNGALVMCGVT